MIWRHFAAWRSINVETAAPQELQFHRRQLRRRLLTSILIGLVGVAVLPAKWITSPSAGLLYWSGVLVLVCWIAILALSDVRGIKRHYQREQSSMAGERADIEADLKRAQRIANNGDPFDQSE